MPRRSLVYESRVPLMRAGFDIGIGSLYLKKTLPESFPACSAKAVSRKFAWPAGRAYVPVNYPGTIVSGTKSMHPAREYCFSRLMAPGIAMTGKIYPG